MVKVWTVGQLTLVKLVHKHHVKIAEGHLEAEAEVDLIETEAAAEMIEAEETGNFVLN
jgi:hypothetical protein